MEILEMTPINQQKTVENIIVDMNIVEYLYTATWNDITSDDELMDLILGNGIYKEVLADAMGMQIIKLKHKDKIYEFNGSPPDVASTLDILQGNTEITMYGIEYKNKD